MKTSIIALRWCFALAVTLLGYFFLTTSFHLFPAPLSDAASHLVPILNYKAGRGFGTVVWPLCRDYDPTGQHRFLVYPPLFHLVVAHLIPQPTTQAAFVCLAGFAVVALLLYAALILPERLMGKASLRPPWMTLACLSLPAISTWLFALPSLGRPEAFTTPLILSGVLGVLFVGPAYRPLVAGIFIGMIAAAQIANGCLTGLLFSTYISLQPGAAGVHALKRWLAQMSLAAGVSLLVFVGCLEFSPHPFMETLRGIAFHLSQLPGGSPSVVSYYLFPATYSTFYGVFLMVLLLHFVVWYRRRMTLLSRLNLGIFVLTAWYFGIRFSNRNYNLLALTPVLSAIALHLVAQLDAGDHPPLPQRQRRWVYAAYFVSFALMSVGLVRQVVLYDIYSKHGVSWLEARARLQELLVADADTPLLFDGGLEPLLTRFDRAYQSNATSLSALDPIPGPAKPLLIIHQWYGRLLSPPDVPGYRMVWNDFIARPPRVLGVKISNAMPGYAFALYKPLPN